MDKKHKQIKGALYFLASGKSTPNWCDRIDGIIDETTGNADRLLI